MPRETSLSLGGLGVDPEAMVSHPAYCFLIGSHFWLRCCPLPRINQERVDIRCLKKEVKFGSLGCLKNLKALGECIPPEWRQYSLRLLCNYSSLSLAFYHQHRRQNRGHSSLSLPLPMGFCGLSLVSLGQARLGHTVARVYSWPFLLQIFS